MKRNLVHLAFLAIILSVKLVTLSSAYHTKHVVVEEVSSSSGNIRLLKQHSRVEPPQYTSSLPFASTQPKKLIDSSNLKLEFCENCDIFLGGLFPVHAPKYVKTNSAMTTPSMTTSTSTEGPTFMAETNSESALLDYDLNTIGKNPLSTTIPPPPSTTMLNIEELPYLADINCGEVKKERGIQRLEAMLFAIDLINNSTKLLPNLKLGARIYDTCDRDTIALEKSINFVSDYFILNDENIINDFTCPSSSNSRNTFLNNVLPRKNLEAIHKRKVIGVIGAASSSVSIQVANLLRLFQIPQISYASTSPELSNKDRFPFFSRVLPSDILQAEAMATLVHSLHWNYITTIHEEGNMGGIEHFNVHAKARKICIAASYTFSQTASEDDVKAIVTQMYQKRNARGVVLFLQDHNIRKLLGVVDVLNMTGHFLWIASDSWGTKKEPVSSNSLTAEGAITFSPKSYQLTQFTEYFKKLTPKENKRNPWFSEFWEDEFNCTIDQEVAYSNRPRLMNRRFCTGNEYLNITQDGFIHFVIDSVYVMANALHNLIQENCPALESKQLSDCLLKRAFTGPELLHAIRNVDFLSITGRQVKFIKDKGNSTSGDGLAPFEVFQYQELEPSKFGYQKITEWEKDRQFTLDKSKLKWREYLYPSSSREQTSGFLSQVTNKLPRSVCKEECENGEVKQGDDCCWVCVKCEENEYVAPSRKTCIKCENGFGPNENKTGCVKLVVEYLNIKSPFTIVPVLFSSVGILFTSFTIYVFLRYSNTPIIKASGRELCYILLAGIMSCYAIAFPLLLKPTKVSCYIVRFGVSLSLTICLSALFTKTNRLSRIFNNSIKQVRQAHYVSPISQIVICFSIISVQLVGIIVWVIVSPPETNLDYDDPKRVILQCETNNVHLALSFIYNFFLVILCTIYAIKTRKIPENFNEARFIGFTMYSILIIWFAFIPIYFGTTAAAGSSKTPRNNYKIQLTTMSMCLSLSATVILFCLFLPKLRVVLLKPNKNVRASKNNIVKSVYNKNVNNSNSASGNSQKYNLAAPKTSNWQNNQSLSYQTTEKSVTVATGISTASSPSSPGTQISKKSQIINSFKTGNAASKSNEHVTAAGNGGNESSTGLLPASSTKLASIDEINSKATVQQAENSSQNPGSAQTIATDNNSDGGEKTELALSNVLTSCVDNLINYDMTVTNANRASPAMKRSVSENKKKDLLLNQSDSLQDEDNHGDPEYYDYVMIPRMVKRNSDVPKLYSKSSSAMELKTVRSDSSNLKRNIGNLEEEMEASPSAYFHRGEEEDECKNLMGPKSNVTFANGPIDEAEFSDNTIKAVVDKCFDQIAKNKKIKSPCIYVKHNKPVNESSQMSSSSRGQTKLVNIKPIKALSTESSRSHKESLYNDNRPCSSSSNSLGSSSDISFINENPSVKQTMVEKATDIINAPTNTILLGGGGGSESNEIYSLKITFV